MIYQDKNPYQGKDDQYMASARKATDILWEATGGDFSSVPEDYLSSLDYSYSDGSISMLPFLNKVDFSESTTYEEYSKAIDSLIKVDPSKWPTGDYSEIQYSKLQYEVELEFEFNEEEFEFAEGEDISNKMELFLKKVIASVYLDGVTSVTDKDGNPPNEANNYLISQDSKSSQMAISGIFYDSPPDGTAKKFPFKITEKSDGNWQIRY